MISIRKCFSTAAVAVLLGVLATLNSASAVTSIYGEDAKGVGLTLDSQQIIVGILVILIIVLMAVEIFAPEVLLFGALVICLLLEILTLPEALSGYSNESMITIGALFLVVGGVEKSHMVDWMARKTFGSEGSTFLGKARMYTTCFCLSTFFNNTPLVAMLMPVVKDWGRMRNIAASQLLLPMNYAVLAGSFGSMIGTSTNLTLQGLMQADRGYSFPFFGPMPIGAVCFFALLLYQLAAAPLLLPNEKVGLIRTARDKASSMMAEIYVAPKSKAAGKSVGEVMTSLGVSPSSVIKIRRRKHSEPGLSASPSADDVRNSEVSRSSIGGNILDLSYLKSHAWAGFKPKPTVNTGSLPEPAIEDASGATTDSNSADFMDIIAPAHHELVAAGDVLFIASAQDLVAKMMKSIAGESKGLYILNSNALALPGFGTELVECVVSETNPFLGMKTSEFAAQWAEKYHAGIITVRGKDWSLEDPAAEAEAAPVVKGDVESGVELTKTGTPGYTAVGVVDSEQIDIEADAPKSESSADGKRDSNGSPVNAPANTVGSISDHVLAYGDIVLCVSKSAEVEKLQTDRDFFVVSTIGSLPKPLTLFKSIPVAIFITMLVLVATENIDMCSASMTVATVFLAGGWIKSSEIAKMVDVKLLFLIGSSISFAKAFTKTGLALEVAKAISNSGGGAQGLMFLVYAITLAMSELISNNAAAALMYPVAVALADELGVSYKPFAMTVMISCTAGFMIPIGYQTHMMVWAPGGYKFKDFVIYGLTPDVIYWVISCLLIPAVFPF